VVVRRPINQDGFNEPYMFLGPSGQQVNTALVSWFRIEKYGSRLRMKQWEDAAGEPAEWLYDGEVDVLRGVNANNLLKPFVSIGHNPDSATNTGAISILSLEFYELTA
jgi:hypothetical protein